MTYASPHVDAELVPENHACPTCKRRFDDVPARDGKVTGNRFVAALPGRYVLAIAPKAGRKPALVEVAVVPRELLDAGRVAVVQRGTDGGQPRPPSQRRSLLTAPREGQRGVGRAGEVGGAAAGDFSLDVYGA